MAHSISNRVVTLEGGPGRPIERPVGSAGTPARSTTPVARGEQPRDLSVGVGDRRHASLRLVSAAASPLQTHPAPPRPVRVEARGVAVYRNFGYDHLVYITNRGSGAVTCSVTTNVNPEPQRAVVPAGAEVAILTWRGSPARVFDYKVTCEALPEKPR